MKVKRDYEKNISPRKCADILGKTVFMIRAHTILVCILNNRETPED